MFTVNTYSRELVLTDLVMSKIKMVNSGTSYFYSIFFVGWTNFQDWLNFRKKRQTKRVDDHTAISKSVVGDHYGQRLYDKWLMRGEACWFETVTCWCLFREFVCNIWKLWEPWVSLKTTKHNPIIIMASKPKTESACQFWNITSEEHQRPFDPFILHHSFGEISFLPSKTCIISGCNSK